MTHKNLCHLYPKKFQIRWRKSTKGELATTGLTRTMKLVGMNCTRPNTDELKVLYQRRVEHRMMSTNKTQQFLHHKLAIKTLTLTLSTIANSGDGGRQAEAGVDSKTLWLRQQQQLLHLLLTAAADVQSGDGGRSDCWAQCELHTTSPTHSFRITQK